MTTSFPEGQAIVYCDGAYGSTNGKTAHGLVRFTRRYRVMAVIDSQAAGADAGEHMGDPRRDIPIVADLAAALQVAEATGLPATHFVIGLAPDGGRLPPAARAAVREALEHKLHVDSGLHDFLGEDPELTALAAAQGVVIRDIRRPPDRSVLHGFSGKIEEVTCLTVALLGTDSAVGKRTTGWKLVEQCEAEGLKAELIGTGQTTWLQGVKYGMILDSLVNDFVSGEIEHATWLAATEAKPDMIFLEGQGSLMNPAYPGGFELLAAGRPDAVILQHAPTRTEYDGFPGFPMHPIEKQIEAIQLISGRPVVAITLNHEGLDEAAGLKACEELEARTGLPAADVLRGGGPRILAVLRKLMTPGGRS